MMQCKIAREVDLVVVGGGLAGVCAAVAAARMGRKVALCHDRGVLGGNSSSECRVWICGATGMGFNRYADETGIVGELTQENLRRNPEGNPHLWDALLLETVWKEKNIELYLDTRMLDAARENGLVKRVTCAQFSTETVYEFSAPLFADCTGDAYLARLATGEGVMGNMDVSAAARAQFGLDDRFAALGSTILFYIKALDHPVEYVAPAFAKPWREIERVLARTGKLVSPQDSGCDYWWLETGGDKDGIRESEEIRMSLLSLVYGVWDYIKNSGKFDSRNLTLEWVGSLPARRESRRAIATYTLTHEDILNRLAFPDAVCHGGWPIDTHPSSGFYDARESCNQLPVKPYDIPLSCLIVNGARNVLLAGRDAGMTHLAMASARVMKTCAVEGQAIGTAAAMALRAGKRPDEFTQSEIARLQQRLLREDVWIPGRSLSREADLARGMRVSSSPALAPDTGEATGYIDMRKRAYIFLPPLTGGARVRLFFRARAAQTLLLSLYESDGGASYTPDALIQEQSSPLSLGGNEVFVACPAPMTGNAVICVERAEGVKIGVADDALPGALGVFSENALGVDFFAPAVRIEGMDGMFACENAVDGFTRPFAGMRLWASPLEGARLALESEAPVRAGEMDIYLENALYRSYNNLRPLKSMYADGYIHPGLLRDMRVSVSGPDGARTFDVRDNCERRVKIDLGGMRVTKIEIAPLKTWGARFAEIHEVALFAPEE